ncbi:hypothetical protein [Mycobacterium deserti]|uniref:Transmembrane protein n=1 Tax=Mycobacterium deserti TaxID=2978347 RepID=A0ABT2MC44_9MYCO|nr:hypothetical protein [Mycobacterium deserti]MCT7658576.1 hypothetical protein [Mycobacterium deserti]
MSDLDELPGDPTGPFTPMFTGEIPVQHPPPPQEPELPSAPALPVAVPGAYQYLKRWTFVLVVACVWIAAAAAGWGLYHWWYHSLDKTAPVFVVLCFLIACTVGGLLTAMVPGRPVFSALAVAITSAPLAATAAAAVLHGLYFCEWASRCLAGVIPY